MKGLRPLRNNQGGFTLVELAVATAVTGILIIVIMSFAIDSFAQISKDSARSDLLREAQISLDTITEDARLSSNAYAASSLLDVNAPVGGTTWTGNGSTLILATAAQDRNKNILFADPLHYTSYKNNRIYYVNNHTLYRRTLAANVANNSLATTCPVGHTHSGCAEDSTLAKNVTNFSIKYYDGNNQQVTPNNARSVEITLELATIKYGDNIHAKYSTRTVFRNE